MIVLVHVLWEEKHHGTARHAIHLRLYADPAPGGDLHLQRDGRRRA